MEDIFAEITDDDSEESGTETTSTEAMIAFEETALEQDLWTTAPEPLAGDLFAVIPEPDIVEQPDAQTESIDDVEQIFNLIPESEIPSTDSIEVTEEIAFEDNLWSEIPEPSLAEDIFTSIPESQIEDESTVETEIDLEQIFDAIPQPSASAETNQESSATVDDIEPILADTSNSEDTASASIIANKTLAETPSTTEDLTTAIDSIEEIFESLPQVNDEQAFTSEAAIKQSKSSKSQPVVAKSEKKVKAVPKLSVRVEMDRLERMNNLVGELTINRNSLAL